jgi:error-prone DNA polymerase
VRRFAQGLCGATAARDARLMAVHGSVEREGEVVHVIARRLADHSELLGRLATSSRDFH